MMGTLVVKELTRSNLITIFDCHNHKEKKLTTRLCLGVSLPLEHKFKCSFKDFLGPTCTCRHAIEITNYYLFHSLSYANKRIIFLDKIRNISSCILEENDTIVEDAPL